MTEPTDQNRLAALYEVSRTLGESLNLDETLAAALEAAIRLTRAERGFVMLFDEDSGELAFRLARNARGEPLAEDLFEVSRSVVREVAQSGASVITANAQHDPRFAGQESVMRYGLRSVITVPLKVRGRIVGALYVDHKAREGLFDTPDLELLAAFAGPAAVAIDNARLYTQTDQALATRLTELQFMQRLDRELNATLDFQTVLDRTLEYALQRCLAQAGWIGLVEADGLKVVARRGEMRTFSPEHPLIQQTLQASEPQWGRPEAAGQDACLAVPVVREERVLALIVVERPDHPFNFAAQEFLVRLADRAAIAVDNARLVAAVQQANDAKSKFVSIVSHELKIPLTAIKGYSDLLYQGLVGPVNDKQSQFLKTIRTNVDRMAVLISDLSDISRIETGRLRMDPAPQDASSAASEALLGLRAQIEARGQVLELDLPTGLPFVLADKSRLTQVLINLVSNAHKYTPSGGRIRVSAAVAPGQPRLRLSVSDTGYGISPEDQARLFSQFFRSEQPAIREETGWGLGLHITRRLVEIMGGEIGLESELEKGSTFWFTLPLA